jgi:hypothetical protein
MKHFLSGGGLVTCAFALVISACSVSPNQSDDPATSSEAALASPHLPRGMMPIRRAAAAAKIRSAESTAPSSTRLAYFGGPVISNVVVHAVYWGRDVAFQSHLNDFYRSVPNSSYLDWLSEYDTPTQNIGRGSFAGATVIQPKNTGTSLTDQDIQDELATQMDAGNLPQADGRNDLFMIHFPPSVSITGPDNAVSCVQFCAYHGTFKKADSLVYYGVMPDLVDTDCNGGCGADSPEENATAVSSHEMVEAITDPAIGVAPPGPPAAPMAWYNEANGEIGDICNAQHARQGSFTVQLQWSNTQRRCVASGPN